MRVKSAAWPMVRPRGSHYRCTNNGLPVEEPPTTISRRPHMDIVVLAIAVIASLLLTRTKALAVAAAGWIFALSMVAWGPAHNSDVHLNRAGFWIPWVIVLAICLLIVAGIDRFKRRAASSTGSQTLA
jgi:hypothetical protein